MKPGLLSYLIVWLTAAQVDDSGARSIGSPTEPPRYSIVRVKVDLVTGQKIGRKRAGLVCLPFGSVVWGKDAAPGEAKMIDVVAQGFEQAGLSVPSRDAELFGQAPASTPFLIAGVIKRATFHTCLPGFGIGDRSSIKGDGQLEIEWKVYSRRSNAVILSAVTREKIAVSEDDGVGIEGLFLRAVEKNASQFADDLIHRNVKSAE